MTCEDGQMLEDIELRDILVNYDKVEDRFDSARRAEGKLQFSPFTPEARGAQAGIVAYNVRGLTLRNIALRWPDQTDVEMHFLWASQVEDAFVDCPRAKASRPETEIYRIEKSDIVVRDL